MFKLTALVALIAVSVQSAAIDHEKSHHHRGWVLPIDEINRKITQVYDPPFLPSYLDHRNVILNSNHHEDKDIHVKPVFRTPQDGSGNPKHMQKSMPEILRLDGHDHEKVPLKKIVEVYKPRQLKIDHHDHHDHHEHHEHHALHEHHEEKQEPAKPKFHMRNPHHDSHKHGMHHGSRKAPKQEEPKIEQNQSGEVRENADDQEGGASGDAGSDGEEVIDYGHKKVIIKTIYLSKLKDHDEHHHEEPKIEMKPKEEPKKKAKQESRRKPKEEPKKEEPKAEPEKESDGESEGGNKESMIHVYPKMKKSFKEFSHAHYSEHDDWKIHKPSGDGYFQHPHHHHHHDEHHKKEKSAGEGSENAGGEVEGGEGGQEQQQQPRRKSKKGRKN